MHAVTRLAIGLLVDGEVLATRRNVWFLFFFYAPMAVAMQRSGHRRFLLSRASRANVLSAARATFNAKVFARRHGTPRNAYLDEGKSSADGSLAPRASKGRRQITYDANQSASAGRARAHWEVARGGKRWFCDSVQ